MTRLFPFLRETLHVFLTLERDPMADQNIGTTKVQQECGWGFTYKNRNDSKSYIIKTHPSMGDSPQKLGNLEHTALAYKQLNRLKSGLSK